MKVLMNFIVDEHDARWGRCLYSSPRNQKLRMPAYLHHHGFMVSLSRVNQDESAPQGFTAPESCPELMAATDMDIRVA